MTDICIVGAGVTGLSMLLLLQEFKVDLSKVTIIDPYFDGGDLARKWTAVESNTPWSKLTNALAAACPSLTLSSDTDPTKTTKLIKIAHFLSTHASSALKRSNQIQGTLLKANFNEETQRWTLHAKVADSIKQIETKQIIITTGSDPKSLNLPIQSIPLEIALDVSRVEHFVKKGQRALVFGTLHSGSVVIRNLVSCGVEVVAIYKSPEPFYWARDGVYDGIKEEAAQIADDIVAGRISAELVSSQDTSKIIRSALLADWTVYAMGFEPRNTVIFTKNGVQQSSSEYDGRTGEIKGLPSAWGFGIAYPNLAPDGIHWDVSVAAFLEHMKLQMPAILKNIQTI